MKTPTGGSYGPRPIPDAKGYQARLIWWIDLGTQKKFFKGAEKQVPEVHLAFELLGTLHDFGETIGKKPFAVFQTFTSSLNEKSNLRKFLETWRNKGFTDEELKQASEDSGFLSKMFAGKPGYLTVKHSEPTKEGKIYANIGSLIKMPEGMPAAPKAVNPIVVFDIESAGKEEVFKGLPKHLKEKIEASPEWSRNPFNDIAPAEDIPEDEF